jgi:hypothetical protein
VGKSEGSSRNQSIINNARTTTVLTSMTTAQTLLLPPTLGCIGCSNGKEGIVNNTYTSDLLRMLAMTTSASATAPAL